MKIKAKITKILVYLFSTYVRKTKSTNEPNNMNNFVLGY